MRILSYFTSLLSRFRQAERASALIEFALLLPILIIVFLGLIGATRFILVQQKMEKTVATMADLLTQSEKTCKAELDQLYTVAQKVMSPFSFASPTSSGNNLSNVITFSSVVNYAAVSAATAPCNTPNVACIKWQYTPGSNGTRNNIGNAGTTPQLPNNMEVAPGQNYIVAEMYYDFYALFLPGEYSFIGNKVGSQALYRIAIFRPRYEELTTLNNTCN